MDEAVIVVKNLEINRLRSALIILREGLELNDFVLVVERHPSGFNRQTLASHFVDEVLRLPG